jgi:solute carrier family 41
MGLLDTPDTRNAFIRGNLALLQLQSLTVGSVAGLFSFVLGKVFHPTSNRVEEIALMISSSMLCAAISSFVLGSFMCALVLVCRKYGINPGNDSGLHWLQVSSVWSLGNGGMTFFTEY